MICSVRIITCTNTGWNAPESFAQLIRTSCAQWRAHYILSNDIEIPDAYIYNTPKNLYRAETSIVVHASVSGETHLSTVNVYIKRTNERTNDFVQLLYSPIGFSSIADTNKQLIGLKSWTVLCRQSLPHAATTRRWGIIVAGGTKPPTPYSCSSANLSIYRIYVVYDRKFRKTNENRKGNGL